MPYPVTFEADYVERRSRLTTFFRWLLAIPHAIVWYFYSLVAAIVVFIAWFALVFTGRYPRGMYDFVAGWLRFQTYFFGYAFLATDEFPPFSGDPAARYPIRVLIAPPLERYSRLKVLFRLILAIPIWIIQAAMQIVAEVGAFLAWFVIIVIGRQPKGLQDMIVLGLSYWQRSQAYIYLLTETWPPFVDEPAAEIERAPAFGAIPAAPPAAAVGAPAATPERRAEAGEWGRSVPEAPGAEHEQTASPPAPGEEEGPPAPVEQDARPAAPSDPEAGAAPPPPPPPPPDEDERPPGPFGPSGS